MVLYSKISEMEMKQVFDKKIDQEELYGKRAVQVDHSDVARRASFFFSND